MRLGYVLPNSSGIDPLDDVTKLAVEAETLGVDTLWVSHHVLHVGFVRERLGTRPYHDALVTLAVVAGATSRARLGVSVLVVPYLHPIPTAKTIATIDQLSGGRFVLGVGVGGLRVEHDAIGQVPYEQRGHYCDEFLDVLRLLWSSGPSSYDGTFFAFADVEASPRPVKASGIPIVVGGGSDAAIRRAVKHGDGWHGLGLAPLEVAPYRARLHEQLEAAGRDVDAFDIEIRLHVDVDDADPSAWADRLDAYRNAGVAEVLLAPQSNDLEHHRRWLAAVVPGAMQARP